MIQSAVGSVEFIASHLKNNQDDRQVVEDWKYISMVLDRIFLILFTAACMLGTVIIILRAPTISDTVAPLA
ncbi:unnamed protein product [Gongylonema pulchrum]|uniref:Neur_chan_memb domain-containing protein n=1 Tax=Gongylonema pulchrum TaxID=637853 RepID=A0A183EC37_9BILA|nr:unnamed protein product [Gongylonema pulchrum]